MKVLITGGNGFIAKNLSEQLCSKYDVVAASRNELDVLDSENVSEYLKKGKFDIVIHTATYDAAAKFSTKDPSKVMENNLRMFFNIARRNDCFGKMIYFGSGAEYSRQHWIPKMNEEYFDRHIPADQYGFSKYVMTKYALQSTNIFNLRLFGVFGKYDDWRTRFVEGALCSTVFNRPILIKKNNVFDHIYIDDLVTIVELFIENNPSKKVYNVCSGDVYEFKTLAEYIKKISRKNLEIHIEQNGIGHEYSGNNSLLLDEFKDIRFRPMYHALDELFDWYVKNQNTLGASM